jgi:2-oxoglutarate ferredoxin oxidoreductase subunit beta
MFNGLHGRALPVAMAIKASNPSLNVIVDSGDGCTYGEGGNHFIAQITRNPDITVIAHDNQIYGLTKGQASPTSVLGMKTPVQVNGVTNEPFNPLSVAIALGASFVARAFVGDAEQTKNILKKALSNKGFSLVDVFCPCVSFNRFNTYKWYKENTYYLDDTHNPHDQKEAFAKSIESRMYPLGIFFINNNKKTFWEQSAAYLKKKSPLYSRTVDYSKIKSMIDSKRKL